MLRDGLWLVGRRRWRLHWQHRCVSALFACKFQCVAVRLVFFISLSTCVCTIDEHGCTRSISLDCHGKATREQQQRGRRAHNLRVRRIVFSLRTHIRQNLIKIVHVSRICLFIRFVLDLNFWRIHLIVNENNNEVSNASCECVCECRGIECNDSYVVDDGVISQWRMCFVTNCCQRTAHGFELAENSDKRKQNNKQFHTENICQLMTCCWQQSNAIRLFSSARTQKCRQIR